ncbi:SGNH/GDSL hydrolase family protein [Shouchella patagoniensis]|uniref:SGNH/GDSL hydrolase family protein n=1 Tax=Shouchella patagoniensis TaxID=228576 RepID=UPI000995B245|nr:SGNH/GDSL hydrolase family protein [Shouchella patagoniensis]
MRIKTEQKLLFIGDSITDCNRQRPDGEGSSEALGTGYVSFVESLLQATYPERKIRVVNKGISGNTVRDLKNRWQEDALKPNPDWLSIMIGINDVWRQFDAPFHTDKHVRPEEFQDTLLQLVNDAKPTVEGIILMTPFYIESSKKDVMRQKMDQYGSIVKEVAEQTNSLFIDTQAVLTPMLDHLYSSAIARDRVHPNPRGHMALARAFLQGIEFNWHKE